MLQTNSIWIGSAVAPRNDVYVCTNLMWSDKRAQGAAVTHTLIHADKDTGQLDPEKVRAIDGFAVASGTPGHGHVYVQLSEPVTAAQHRVLCRALGDYLGGADAKISDNDVLRPPGTLNHKPTVTGGEPAAVEWLVRPNGVRVDPQALAHQLGVTLTEITIAPSAGPAATAEPVDLAGYPRVRAAIEKNTGDRSADTMRVVGACRDDGLTLAQTRYVVSTRADLAGRLADRRDDDVLTCWLKAVDSRQENASAAVDAAGESETETGELTGDGLLSDANVAEMFVAPPAPRKVLLGERTGLDAMGRTQMGPHDARGHHRAVARLREAACRRRG